MTPCYDAVVVGAGPYGLSTAAHLLGRGLNVAVFGRTLELWRERMPKGMWLRSHWWATNLSDPRKAYGFGQFFEEAGYAKGHPVPLETFINYGLWFQRRAVPNVDETYVASIERRDGQFAITLEDGREVTSRVVVMAIGPYHFAHRPEQYNELPAEFVSHSSDHSDFKRFEGQDVVVIGGGQSAIEYAALLHEAGAAVQVVSRRRISWLAPDRMDARSILERIRAPRATIAAGWDNWVLDRMPYFFYRFPQAWKDAYNRQYHSGASDWLRDRVIGKVRLREAQTVANLAVREGKLDATISDGAKLRADHIMLATGYKVDVNRLKMIHPALRRELKTDVAVPILSHGFESSIPGLYFVGLTSLRAFGPLFRFVAGCTAAAHRVASSVGRTRVARARTTPRRATVANAAAGERQRARQEA